MTTFTYGGTALSSFGKVTVVDEYLDMPKRRGGNQVIPFHHGTVFVQKFFEERRISMGIAVITASATALETAMDTMRALFTPLTQQTLSMTLTDTTVRTALASVDDTINVHRISDKIAKVIVNFVLTEPFFRLSTAITDNTTAINATPNAMTVTNPGTVDERNATIIIHGAFTSVAITNSTNSAVLTYTGAISTSETVTIGTLNGELYATLSTGSTNVVGNCTHAGSATWLPLNVGANTLSIVNAGRDANSTVKVTFNAPFA